MTKERRENGREKRQHEDEDDPAETDGDLQRGIDPQRLSAKFRRQEIADRQAGHEARENDR